MFCGRCGNQCAHSTMFCTVCGARIGTMMGGEVPTPTTFMNGHPYDGRTYKTVTTQTNVIDEVKKPAERGGFGWFLLGFILGLGLITIILLCVWWKDFPNRCRSILGGAIISFIVWTIAIVLFILLGGYAWFLDWVEGLANS